MTKLPNKYDHKSIEEKWQKYWQENNIYKWQNNQPKDKTFVIDTPPPTVSGLLHMGHVFSYVQADFIARFQRMSGKDVFYPMGFDDNGLPTERLVEKIIGKKAAIYETENGRGSFVKKCQEVVEEAEKDFEALFNEIALSVDWDQKYQTISPQSQKISQASFVDIYNKGLASKKMEPVFWDISDRTALAQADLVDKEIDGAMHDIVFKDESGEDLIIMTTRPELLPACVAVMINPQDSRFQHLIKNDLSEKNEGETGSFAYTAIFGVKVPIIADELVQMDKGTGVVMCCTFGDETDIAWWRKHNLPTRVIIGRDGKIDWQSLNKKLSNNLKDKNKLSKEIINFCNQGEIASLKEVKKIIVNRLEELNLLISMQPIKHAVKCAERSGVPIEIIVQPQWFIKILDKKAELKTKANECKWYPEYMKLRLEQWIDGLSWDWCISRQRFFGVKFPVWYSKRSGEEGKILIADINQLPVDPANDLPYGYDRHEVDYEADIMDTWATSSISPQLSSRGISQETDLGENERHQKLFPADLRPQAHEIIRTWAFYTIVKALLHENKAPWKNLMISGWCLAADKTKMSKSKGNVVTPTALIKEKGSDIVRYWASTSHLGADTAYSEDVFRIGAKLITKIFNAAKFVEHISISNQDQLDDKLFYYQASLELISSNIIQDFDKWILSKLHLTIKNATASFEKYEYARAREFIEDFFWNDFCDNYLEICKVRAYGINAQKYKDIKLEDKQQQKIIVDQKSAIITLNICLQNLLRLFAPFVPHLCDEIYSSFYSLEFNKIKSLSAINNWPKSENLFFSKTLQEIGDESLKIISDVRKFKSENNLSMKTSIDRIDIDSKFDLSGIIDDLKNVCNSDEIIFNHNKDQELTGVKIYNTKVHL